MHFISLLTVQVENQESQSRTRGFFFLVRYPCLREPFEKLAAVEKWPIIESNKQEQGLAFLVGYLRHSWRAPVPAAAAP